MIIRLAAAALCCSQAAAEPLEDARWARPDADIVRILTTSPGECLRPPATKEEARRVEIGRAAFRTPFLFGGTAARAGLSCNSCHRDGHDNPDFFLEGLSGAPGAADVTSSVFSKVREDGVFNPVTIPTLVDAGKKSSFGATSPHGSLDEFIASAVDEEFAGAPPPSVIPAIAAYVAALDSAACPKEPAKTTLDAAMKDARRALLTAQAAFESGDAETASFLLLAARGALGRVHQRLQGDRLEKERATLTALSAAIGDVRAAAGDKQAALAGMPTLLDQFDAAQRSLRRARKKTLFEPKALRRWLEAREEAPH